MRKLKKIYIKNLKGFIYVESYNGKNNEESERAKIYDENQNYLDYIPLDQKTKKEYKGILKEYKQVKNIADMIENCLFYNVYDYSENLEYLLYSVLDGQEEEVFEELENDLKTMNEKELVYKYEINRIGDHYFYLGYC